MSGVEMQALAQRLTDRFGLVPRDSWGSDLEAGLRELVDRTRLSRAQVVDGVLADDRLATELAQHVTVGETHFLRCAPHFESLARHVDARLRVTPPDAKVTVVSAGCASGEEPYSAAIAVSAFLGDHSLERLHVIGIDLNHGAVACAREARYRPWSFRGAPPWLVARYTAPVPDAAESREVLASVRTRVRFEQGSLLDGLRRMETGSIDAVLFRNVAIYLAPAALQAIYAEIARVLRLGGFLAVSPSDPRPLDARLRDTGDATTSVYRRAEPGEAAAERAPAPTPRPEAPVTGRAPALRPARRESLTPPPSRPAPAAPRVVEAGGAADIRALADRGQGAAALSGARAWAEREPDSADARLLTGQLLLESGDVEPALVELRKSVFLASRDPLMRFWYASALLATRRLAEARRQTAAALALLRELRSHSTLSDGETRVCELVEALAFLEETVT